MEISLLFLYENGDIVEKQFKINEPDDKIRVYINNYGTSIIFRSANLGHSLFKEAKELLKTFNSKTTKIKLLNKDTNEEMAFLNDNYISFSVKITNYENQLVGVVEMQSTNKQHVSLL